MEIRMPDLGSFKDVAVIDVLVKVGDAIEAQTPIATLETEKATMDVPSPAPGRVAALHVAKGNKVNTGDLLISLVPADAVDAANAPAAAGATPASAASAAPEAPAASAAAIAPATASATATPTATAPTATAPVAIAPVAVAPITGAAASGDLGVATTAYAGPSVRKLARELGVNLGQVSGSGIKRRITHDDVKAWVKRALAAGSTAAAAVAPALPRVPNVNFAAFGEIDVKPLSRVQKISGARLRASWLNLPHVTQFDSADITELEDARAKLKQRTVQQGIRLTPLAFMVRACVRALAQFPKFNASLDESGQNLVYKKYVHIGFAADTPNGLLVPVIHDADKRDVYEIARALSDLSEKARVGKLTAVEMQGGCFTISSLGGIGGTAFTPIINAPEVAILGVSRSSMQPVYRDGNFVPRLMLPLSLSYDHRVIDGAEAARFTTFLVATLADPRSLLEAVPR